MSDQIISTDPAHNFSPLGQVTVTSTQEISTIVRQSKSAAPSWHMIGLDKRKKLVIRLIEAYKARASDIAASISKEVGTPISECADEVAWDWGYANWFIDHVSEALDPVIVGRDASSIHTVYYEPYGVAAVITPWNLPFDMFIWGVIPNLLVGNTVVYKAAEECILTGVLFEDISKNILPSGILSFVHGGASQGAALTDEDIDLLWFTGSTAVGQQLYKKAGEKFIKAILEMGGSNPAIILSDADIDLAVKSIISERFMFCGQTCDADKRLLVHESVVDTVVKKLTVAMGQIHVGDPALPGTTMGPLVSMTQYELLISQVQDAVKKGAHIVTGGTPVETLQGAYALPTVLTGITPVMRVWKEEVFGPVLPVATFSTIEEAIALANDTEFGLGSQIFTNDISVARTIASQLHAGNVDINGVGHFRPFNPFGGYKKSGMGREHGIDGFRELSQVKVVSAPQE